MKNTLITLASVAALAGSVNAQTSSYFIAYDSGSNGYNRYDYDSATNAVGALSGFVAHGGFGSWTGIDFSYNSTSSVYESIAFRASSNSLNKFSYDSSFSNVVSSTALTLAGGLSMANYEDVAWDGSSTLFAFDSDTGNIDVLSISGTTVTDSGADFVIGGVTGWTGIATDIQSGNSYIYDANNSVNRINRFSHDGLALTSGLSIVSPDPQAISFTGAVGVVTGATVVPEPSSTALLGLGGLALILRRRK